MKWKLQSLVHYLGTSSLLVGAASLQTRRNVLLQCSALNSTIEADHTNPCWRVNVQPGCNAGCQQRTVCAPKVIFAGVNGCYNAGTLSSFTSLQDVLMVKDRIRMKEICPLTYLAHHYQKMLMTAPAQTVLCLNDDHLLTLVRKSSVSLRNTLRWLSQWFQPGSRLVVLICDPAIRLLRHMNETMVTLEPTKQAVHNYILVRIKLVQNCIDENGAKACQHMDAGDDLLYSYLLQGIYFPYMADLRNHISSNYIKPIYLDPLNRTAYANAMNDISTVLSLPSEEWSLQQSEDVRLAEAKAVQDLMSSISPQTINSINRFYDVYKKDIKHILTMYS